MRRSIVSTHYKFDEKEEDQLIGDNPRKKEKMESWMTADLELMNIVLTEEQFSVSAKICVLFQDKHQNFRAKVDDKSMDTINEKGFVRFEDLPVEVVKELPLKRGFLSNAIKMDIQRSYLEMLHEADNIWMLYFRFEAEVAEHFELNRFPFDAQFLNMQITYRVSKYQFVDKCPKWITRNHLIKKFDVHVPFKQTTADSVKDKWIVADPWVDLRQRREEYDFNFSLIRLRVRRDPTFWLINAVLPLFLVLMCSFAQAVMPSDEFVGDKLSFIVTLLLTTAAFQYAVSADMPKTSESTMIDLYILWAYGILTCLVMLVAVLYRFQSDDTMEVDATDLKTIEYCVCAGFCVIWTYQTGKFGWEYYCFRYRDVDWEKLSTHELSTWDKEVLENTKLREVDKDHFFV